MHLTVVAGGLWAGAPWPDDLLDGPTGRIGDFVFPVVNPCVQLEIKEKVPAWRPDLEARDKHQEDIARLREALAASSTRGLDAQ